MGPFRQRPVDGDGVQVRGTRQADAGTGAVTVGATVAALFWADPGVVVRALAQWIDRFVDFLVTKHGLAAALRSDSYRCTPAGPKRRPCDGATVSILLRPISPQDYSTFLEQAAETYAAGAADSGEMTYEQARLRAHADLTTLLPAGLQTPGMLLRTISSGNQPVGHIWLGLRGPADAKYGWVWSVHVDPQHRSRGHAGEAIRLAEAEARTLFGITEVRLNVFGANRGAVRLYERLGYAVTSQVMRKVVD
jgi:ribosomal protein S18 acetylase RimI-like enzyme